MSLRTAVACDLTAAHMWSVTLPSGFGIDIDAQACAIATVRDGSRHRATGIRGRRLELPAAHLTTLDGVTITTPARTWLDCAALVSITDVVAMGDAILRARLATDRQLEEMVLWGRGRRGVRAARLALPILDGDAESPGESWVRGLLMLADIPRPVCNLPITVAGWPFRLDMAWKEKRVAVEYDGAEYHGPEHQARDQWRRDLLAAAGWTVIVVRKEDFAHFERIIQTVRAALIG